MQYKTTETNKQEFLALNGNKGNVSILGVDWGGRNGQSLTPHGGVRPQVDPLLYLNDHNGDKNVEISTGKVDWSQGSSPKSNCAKRCFALTKNINSYSKKYGIERLGFLTLTFKGNLTDEIEAQRRYKNLTRTWNREKPFKVLCRVMEFQKRGAIHYHLLVLMKSDIRTGFNWEAFKKAGECQKQGKWSERQKWTRVYAKSSREELRQNWSWLRLKCESHGFGRSELMPIEYPDNIGSYLGKYLVKEDRKQEARKNHEDLGVSVDIKKRRTRMITYSKREHRVANTRFSWVKNKTESKPIRKRIGEWASYRGFKNTEEIKKFYGPRWSYHLYGEFLKDELRQFRQKEGLPSIAEVSKGGKGFEWAKAVTDQEFDDYLKSDNKDDPESWTPSTQYKERKRLEAYRYHKKHSYIHSM